MYGRYGIIYMAANLLLYPCWSCCLFYRYIQYMITSWMTVAHHIYSLAAAIWRCRNPFSQWQRSFRRKLRSHWLKFLRQRHVAVVRQGPVTRKASPCHDVMMLILVHGIIWMLDCGVAPLRMNAMHLQVNYLEQYLTRLEILLITQSVSSPFMAIFFYPNQNIPLRRATTTAVFTITKQSQTTVILYLELGRIKIARYWCLRHYVLQLTIIVIKHNIFNVIITLCIQLNSPKPSNVYVSI